MSWRNWDADILNPRRLFEVALYTDRRATGSLSQVGPYSVHITVPCIGAEKPTLEMTLRVFFEVPDEGAPAETSDTTYHGGDIFDEVAALLSLALGVRCKAGGIIRRWDILDDPLGQHVEWDHDRPYLFQSRLKPQILPQMTEEFLLSDARPYLEAYGRLPPNAANTLVRAARLYQEAIWIADGDPNQAWISLVSAVEVVANLYAKPSKSAEDRIRLASPELHSEIATLPVEQRARIAALLAPNVRVAAKFLYFLQAFMPDPPPSRPDHEQVDWAEMPDLLRTVYKYRSRSLHDGTPFPAPMCESPTWGVEKGGAPREVPLGLSKRVGPNNWVRADTPMLLHVFEYIARSALCTWWLKQGKG